MRDYDPTTGRYLQADPLGLVDGASVYGYARQNPSNKIDPLGLFDGSSYPEFVGVPARDIDGIGFGGGGGGAVGSGVAAAQVAAAAAAVGADGIVPQGIGLNGEATTDDAVPQPEKRGGKYVCICKARSNDNILGNCPDSNGFSFAFGKGIGPSRKIAHLMATLEAQGKLQCQGKHTTCKCTGPRGDPMNDK